MPILFVTPSDDPAAVRQAYEAGADDVVSRPYNRAVLRAKLEALLRLRAMYATERRQTEQLVLHNEQLRSDQLVAEKIFGSIVRSGTLDAPNIRYVISPMAIFNGDLLLAAPTPSGGLQLLLGDFTGHGLSAALGALPVSEIFYGMTAKGFSIGEIAREINRKLRANLPTGLFLAATLLHLDAGQRGLSVWSGGLPDLYVRGEAPGVKYRLISRHLPLGVDADEHFDAGMDLVEVEPGDRILIYTDGLIEARDARGEMFGQRRLESLIDTLDDARALFPSLCHALESHVGQLAQSDDVTFAEIVCDPSAAGHLSERIAERRVAREPAAWKIGFSFSAAALRSVDPLPLLIQNVMEIQGLHGERERLYTVLAELYSNALDHGLLGLDSALKRSPEGFAQYYQSRQERLAALAEAEIAIELEHVPEGAGGRLVLRLKDSGPGFDWQRSGAGLETNLGHSGRGMALVRRLCRDVAWAGRGNEVEAVYAWGGREVADE